jgi:tetratricopeptide (TPR) repeat protein
MREALADFAMKCAVVVALAMYLPSRGQATPILQDPAGASSYRESDAALLERARTLAQTASLEEAEQTIRRYLAHNEASAEGHFLLGYILFKAAKPKDSLQEYTEAAKYQEPGASELKIVALDYGLLDDYPDAERWLKESLASNPKDVESWYYLGRAQYSENHFADALNSFAHCLALDPRHVKAKANLGLALEGLHRTEEAAAAYRAAISWEEQGATASAEPYIDLGSLLLEQNQNEQAVTYLLQAVKIAPEEVRARERLGTAYFRLNKLSEAQTQLEKAVQLTPTNSAIHYILGQTYRKEGLLDKARTEFARATELNGSHSSLAPGDHGIAKP